MTTTGSALKSKITRALAKLSLTTSQTAKGSEQVDSEEGDSPRSTNRQGGFWETAEFSGIETPTSDVARPDFLYS
jgi:hypothetical protein